MGVCFDMARKIQHKRGLEKDLPQLAVAEIGFTTDTKKPFIGSDDGNIEIAKAEDVEYYVTHLQADYDMKIDNVNTQLSSQLADTTQQNRKNIFRKNLSNRSQSNNKRITIIDDDGRVDVYTKLKNFALSNNIPITSALITNRVGIAPYMSLNQIKDLSRLGFEFVSHTANHPYLYDIPLSEAEEELRQSAQWLYDNGFDGSTAIVYPYGSHGGNVQKIARKYYRVGIDIDNGLGAPATSPIDTYKLRRMAFNLPDGTQQVNHIKNGIDQVSNNGGWLIVMTHCWYDGFDISALQEVVDYAKINGLKFSTVREALDDYENLIDIDNKYQDIKLGADGETGDRDLTYMVRLRNYVTNTTPLSEYPKGTSTTLFTYGHPNVAEFPENEGLLTTYNYSPTYNYQIFFNEKNQNEWIRTSSGDVWSDWKLNTNVGLLGHNAISVETLPKDYPYKVTIFNVNSGQSGYPASTGASTSLGGTLVNIALSTSEAFHMQIYKEIRSGYTWFRHVTSGVFSEWQSFGDAYRLPVNTVTAETPITDFPLGITLTYLNSNGILSGFPDNTHGVLTTYRESTLNGWSYQEFKKYNSFDKYIRFVTNTGSWSEWKKYQLVE